jgi:hypothetical protein
VITVRCRISAGADHVGYAHTCLASVRTVGEGAGRASATFFTPLHYEGQIKMMSVDYDGQIRRCRERERRLHSIRTAEKRKRGGDMIPDKVQGWAREKE